MNVYFSYSEGSRAPTSVELGCANPDLPCKLPNAMAGDPPLQQVVARTFEAGVRSGSESKVGWSAGWFRAQNSNDILFVAATATGFGYFKNFGKTRRQGFEATCMAASAASALGGGYTFLDATYQSPETVAGAGNSANNSALSGSPGLDGDIEISPGDRIPLTPRHMLKAYADVRATKKLTVDLSLTAHFELLGARQREQPPPGGRSLLSWSRAHRGLQRDEPGRRAMQLQKHVELFVAGQQSAEPSLLHRSPARRNWNHGTRDLHCAAHCPLSTASFL